MDVYTHIKIVVAVMITIVTRRRCLQPTMSVKCNFFHWPSRRYL